MHKPRCIRAIPFRRTTAIGAIVVALLFPHLLHAFTELEHTHDLPDFDRRHEPPAAAGPLAPAKQAAARKLMTQVRGLRVEHDALRQSPKHIASASGFLTGPDGEGVTLSAASARTTPAADRYRTVKAFLNEHATLFGHHGDVLDKARLKRDAVARNNGLRTIVWEQRVDDIVVYEGVLVSHLTQRGELVSIASQFIAEPERAADAGTPDRVLLQAAPLIPPAQAVLLAATSLEEILALDAIVPLWPQPEGREQRQLFRAGPLPGEAQARLVWLPLSESSLALCWEVELTRRAGNERYRVVLDARTGEVQLRRRLTIYLAPATYFVFTSDSPTPFSPGWPAPNSNQPPAVARSRVTLPALNTNASPIGWISDGENETRGNNVDAHADRNADDIPDLPRPQGSPFRIFSPALDLSQPPAAYTDAATVNLFYWCNWMHDRLYELGFDEASGNFQKDNFGRGGLGNDPILAQAQDGSGFNNANFTPTPDGAPGRIQMFIWNGPSPGIDGDFDAEVILHEYTHGLSTRLVGGGVGIGALQSAGMGEGWSDFYALALLSEPGDDVDASYPFGAYVSFRLDGLAENYYFGIRRYPYSTDLARNPLTFKDIDPAQISPHPGVPMNPIYTFNPQNAAQVHAQGEVWCSMLWEARANLVRKHGHASGNQLMLQLVTDGMKLSPPNPSFTQARDAIILADLVNNQGANYGDLWAAFAKRGLGFSAIAPDSSTTSGVVEAYDLPDALFLSNPASFVASGPVNGPFTPACQTYPLTNISEQPLSWTARAGAGWLSLSPSGGTLAPGAYTNVTVCLDTPARALPLGSFADMIVFSNTVSKVTQRRLAEIRVLGFTTMPFREDFEDGIIHPYWSLTGTGARATQISSLNGPHGGKNHLTLDSVGGTKARNEVTLGLDLGGFTNVVLRFWAKSFGDEPDGPPPAPFRVGADFDGVAISEDGINWYEVQSLRNIPSAYTEFTVDLDAAIAARGLRYNSTFLIRFNQVDDFQIPFDGLALDDISIAGTPATRLAVNVPPRAREGDGLLPVRGSVAIGSPAASAVSVSLAADLPKKVSLPAVVVIPAGSDRAEFPITLPDDSLLDGTTEVVIRAEAPGFFGGSGRIAVDDNEKAALRVKLPPKVREGGGRMPRQGVVRASSRPARDVTVQLVSSDPDELRVPETVVIPAGRLAARFDLDPVDDNRIDGSRLVCVTAHVANWIDGEDWIWVLDNDDPVLFVELPLSVSEGNGTLTNAGAVRLSGTLPVGVSVRLASSDSTELLVPASIEIPAGQLEARFDLTVADDALVDGRQTVAIRATAPGFAGGLARTGVFDDETPPVPLLPEPPHGASNVAVSVALSWNPGIGNILLNGGFETGDFSGWRVVNTGYGSWIINDGTVDPDGPEETNAPPAGRFSAMTAQIGGGSHLLYQDVFIPPDALSATLNWSDRIRNHTPYFAPNQVFRVEIRDTNDAVLALAFTTKLGDPLLTDWTARRFDLTPYRGRTVRIAFYQEDSTGYFNAYVDEISVRLGEPAVATTFDVYFGQNPLPGSAEFRGNTPDNNWSLPPLALNTTYYWQIIARRGAAQTLGPVWSFTTRGVGAVSRFEWARIASPQFTGQRFPVTLTAKDDIGNTVKNFDGAVFVTGLPGNGSGSSVVISELDIGAGDRVEFVNASTTEIDLSGWRVSVYDGVSWPAPVTTMTIPARTICPRGGIFTLTDNGEAPGSFPSFFTGTNVTWTLAPLGNAIAVLLQDAGGDIVDFVCAGNSDPSLITRPRGIPAGEWNGLPVSALLSTATLTLQRTGSTDLNGSGDWTNGPSTFGVVQAGLGLPLQRQSKFAVEPTVLTNFTTGVWSGFLTISDPAPRLTLRAEDAGGRFGLANEIAVGAVNDLGVTVADSPDVGLLGATLTYRITVTNSGPDKATGVLLTNSLPAGVNFVSYATFNGTCEHADGRVVCELDDLSAGDSARVALTTQPTLAGLLTNRVTVTRAEPDGFAGNNTAEAVTTITVPSIAITNLTVSEGNNPTNLLRVPVRLSAASTLPVSVAYATSNSTAVAGEDYVATSGVLVFPPGTTNLTVDVPVIGDRLDENLETFFIQLSNPNNANIVAGLSRCRITDDDPTPTLTIRDALLVEGPPGSTNYAEFQLRLNAPSGTGISLSYTTEDRTAIAPSDYLTTFGTVQFPPGTTNQIIRVPVLGDSRFEPSETFALRLFNFFAVTVSRNPAIATIQDDDDTEVDRFVWSEVPSPQFAGVPFFASLTARDGLDRTATSFNGTVSIQAIADSREKTVGTGTNLWEFPAGGLFHDARTQVIYLPGELGGPGKINALALQMGAVPGQTLSNWTIRLKHSPLTRYVQAAWDNDGWTTVYRSDESLLATGWVTFLFQQPFEYDGRSSVLLDFSFNNATYSVSGLARSTVTPDRRSVFFETDSAFGDPLGWSGPANPPPRVLERIPNVRFLFETPVAFTPEGPVRFTAGTWSGSLSMDQPATNVFLRSNDGAGRLAASNPFAVLASTDTDQDGLPDAWETRLFGAAGARPEDDADSDHVSNLEEYLSGTNPLDPGSVATILAVERRGLDVVIRLSSAKGRAYRVERTYSLHEPEWKTVTPAVPGTGLPLEVLDAGAATNGNCFYRIRIVP